MSHFQTGAGAEIFWDTSGWGGPVQCGPWPACSPGRARGGTRGWGGARGRTKGRARRGTREWARKRSLCRTWTRTRTGRDVYWKRLEKGKKEEGKSGPQTRAIVKRSKQKSLLYRLMIICYLLPLFNLGSNVLNVDTKFEHIYAGILL